MTSFLDAMKAAESRSEKPSPKEENKAETMEEKAPFETEEKKPAPTGFLSEGSFDDEFAPPAENKDKYVNRFWMKPSSEKKIIFLSKGKPLVITEEHQFKLNGHWRNWFTCLRTIGAFCPLCKFAEEHPSGLGRAYKAAYFTILDPEGYTKKDGTVVKNVKLLMTAKRDTIEHLKRKYAKRVEQGHTLRGAKFEVYRSNNPKSPSVGDGFDFLEQVDLDIFPDTDEFDYSTVLAPDPEKCEKVYTQLISITKPAENTQVDY